MKAESMICRKSRGWVAALLVICFSFPAWAADDKPSENLRIAKALSGAFAEVVDKVSPAVVGIRKVSNVTTSSGNIDIPDNFPFKDDEMFKRFFRNAPRQSPLRRKLEGYGSGIVLNEKGYILTNNHVVDGADKLIVEFSDDTKIEAEIVGTDNKTDIAVIKLKEKKDNIKIATLGDSGAIKVGNIVLAIGSPFSLRQTVTSGIVSAKQRSVGMMMYENFIQTDASINPGNSGGPLINLDGEVIGINTLIQTRTGGSVGVGFAVPINMVKNVIEQLIDKGKVTRGWLGVGIADVDQDMAEAMPGVVDGVIVTEVYDNTPAKDAGLEPGDVIVKFSGQAITGTRKLQSIVADTDPGKVVDVEVVRKGETKNLKLTVGKQPDNLVASRNGNRGGNEMDNGEHEAKLIGVKVQVVNDSLRRLYGLDKKAKGLVVREVTPDSPADEAGIVRGALIIELDQKPVHDLAVFKEILGNIEKSGKKQVLVYFRLNDIPQFKVLKLK